MEDVDSWKEKFTVCVYAKRILDKLIYLNNIVKVPPVDIQEVKKSIYYAKKYHGDQMRQSGEPFYSHPLEVAYMVSDYLFKTDMIITAILHDTIEDTELTKEKIATIFGDKIANQVDDLTKIKADRKISAAEMVEILYQQKKYDLLKIKLFDRLHNLQTIFAKSPEKIEKIIDETIKDFLILCTYFEYTKLEDYLYTLCYNSTSIKYN